jgi:hypothetical protein
MFVTGRVPEAAELVFFHVSEVVIEDPAASHSPADNGSHAADESQPAAGESSGKASEQARSSDHVGNQVGLAMHRRHSSL